MTREDAINYFKRSWAIGEGDDSRYHNEVLEFTIKALEKEPCEDAISREEVIEEIQKLRGCSCSCSDGIIDDVEDILDKLIESEKSE